MKIADPVISETYNTFTCIMYLMSLSLDKDTVKIVKLGNIRVTALNR